MTVEQRVANFFVIERIHFAMIAAIERCEGSVVVYGSTVTSTNAGKLSAPFLSVTRNLKR